MSKNAVVAIVMGSKSDGAHLDAAVALLDEFGIAWETQVLSAHRQPDKLRTYVDDAVGRGIQLFIAAAGLSAALPGVIASHTTLPVIGVPIPIGPLNGADALLAMVQMPAGIPVATVGLGTHGPKNAAVLAAEILALSDARVAGALRSYRNGLADG